MNLASLPLIERISWAQHNLERVIPERVVVFESSLDKAEVMYPTGEWMACALHGDILPPWIVYPLIRKTGQKDATRFLMSGPPVPAMVEQEAMEYLVKAMMPACLWDGSSNRQKFYFAQRDQIPDDRTFRDIWSLVDGEA